MLIQLLAKRWFNIYIDSYQLSILTELIGLINSMDNNLSHR
jgi:hypothetical protein